MDCPTAILWPWDVFSFLWNSGNFDKWAADNSNPSDRAQEYWRRCMHLDFFSQLGLREDQFRTCIPLMFHCDGVKIYKQQKAWIYSCASATRKGPSIKTKAVFLLFRENMLLKGKTHDAIGLLVSYICNTLMTGCFPKKDPSGMAWRPGTKEHERANTPFCGGWTFAFAGFKGDWEARVIVHKLQRSYRTTNICEHCLACYGSDFTFGDFRPTAHCHLLRFSHEDYLRMAGQ